MASLMTPEAFASTNFDYLIAGGGTAGLVLANRLTEIPTVTVGVIEAGEDLTDDVKVTTPLYMFDVQGNPKYDWGFLSEPQEALNGSLVAQARGKMLGGSSGINFMQTTFASRADLDDWELLGNTGWNYDSMAPYYRKFENFQTPRPEVEELGIAGFINEAAHGHGGPINASLTPFYTPMQAAWSPTLANMGLAPNGDPRDGVSLGGYNNPMVMTSGTSRRSFAGNSYWKPFAGRPNLHTITKAVVQKVIFSSDKDGDQLATGLNFTANNQTFIANASREIILSGGTMKSPQMLELSGIGNATLLRSFGIDPLIDNPNVGENLQDHPQCSVPFVPAAGDPTFDDLWDPERNAHWTRVFEANGTGVLAGGISDTAQLPWPQILGPEKQGRPQELVAKYYNSSASGEGLRPGLKAQLDLTAKKLLDANEQAVQTSGTSGTGSRPKPGKFNQTAYIGGFVTHPFSRGWIHIRSPRAEDDPAFDPRYLSHPLDYEVLKDLQFFSLNISTTPPMSQHLQGNGTPSKELTESTVHQFINEGFITGWHVVGSCAMMPQDRGGVVDTRLRVYGTRNLRVVDASVVPLHVRGNTGTLTYAIAEKAADIVKADMGGVVEGTGAGGAESFVGAAAERRAGDGVVASLLAVVLGVVVLLLV